MINAELSTISGFVEGTPIISRQSMEATTIISSGDWMIPGGLDNWHQRKEKRGLLGLLEIVDDGLTDVIIMLQAKRIIDVPDTEKEGLN